MLLTFLLIFQFAYADTPWSCIRQLTERRQVPSLAELEMISDQHSAPLLEQMSPELRVKFERLIHIQQNSHWKTPEQPLAALLSAHLLINPSRDLSEVQVPVVLIQETTLWVRELARRNPTNVQALMLQSYSNDILSAEKTVRYGSYIDLTVRAIWFLDHPGLEYDPNPPLSSRVSTHELLNPANPFLIPIPTHRKLWIRDWIGLAAPEQIYRPAFALSGTSETSIGFYTHDQSHTRQMQLGALFRRWTPSSRVHQLVQNRNSPLVSSNFLPLLALELETLLDGAIQDFAARSLLVSTLETLSTQAGRDAVESFLFNRFHERGTLVPSLNELRADGTVSNPEAWRPFLNGVVVVQAGWGLTDRIRLDRASVRAEFHRWYLTHYLSFVEHYIKTYGDYPAHETNEMLNLIRVSRGQTR